MADWTMDNRTITTTLPLGSTEAEFPNLSLSATVAPLPATASSSESHCPASVSPMDRDSELYSPAITWWLERKTWRQDCPGMCSGMIGCI